MLETSCSRVCCICLRAMFIRLNEKLISETEIETNYIHELLDYNKKNYCKLIYFHFSNFVVHHDGHELLNLPLHLFPAA